MRTKQGFIKTVSKDGGCSAHIGAKTNRRLNAYCEPLNINKGTFIEECVNARLDELEKTMFDSMTKDQLIAIIRELRHPNKQLELEV